MFKPEHSFTFGLLALIVLVVLYLIWPYVVGFLACVGAYTLYQCWRGTRR
jgi:hypothetical protein